MAAKLDAPGQVEMKVGNVSKPLEELTPKDVGQWLEEQGLGHLSEAFIYHKISGVWDVIMRQHLLPPSSAGWP